MQIIEIIMEIIKNPYKKSNYLDLEKLLPEYKILEKEALKEYVANHNTE